jgi:hypothetical protein
MKIKLLKRKKNVLNMLIDTTTHAGEDIEKKEGTFLIS